MIRWMLPFTLALATTAAVAQTGTPPVAPAAVPVEGIAARIVARYPHDRTAFTQGLVWHDGALFESTGQPGVSDVRRVRLADGKVLARTKLPGLQFGEGLAVDGNQLVSITWQDGIAHRWDAKTLKSVGRARYPGEGWGLASDGTSLILSDGTPTLRFMDPKTFKERRRVTITANGRPVHNLNELEMIDGKLWGNIWHRDYIVRIDPATGVVDALVDLAPLRAELGALDPEAVLNGIAWDAGGKRLFVTGKWWPTLFEIALEPVPQG
ncbi:glutaminyl-peptide cyclotransferase [Sphingomonas hankookensis]|uniref:glutaminyl-peptide cyclotransferase n=1 Tax=Sphingomonas hankookensis TaxID=563996 RepID=UPI001F59B8A2|nr:glutaminyl-peptide cyclotransferase [Sphingomonas hankookensis]